MPFWKFSLLKKFISFNNFAFRWLKRKLTLLFCKSIIQVIEQVCNFCFAFDNTFPSNEIYVWKSLKIKADVSWETITVLERQEFWIWRWEVFSRTPNFPKSEKSFDLIFSLHKVLSLLEAFDENWIWSNDKNNKLAFLGWPLNFFCWNTGVCQFENSSENTRNFLLAHTYTHSTLFTWMKNNMKITAIFWFFSGQLECGPCCWWTQRTFQTLH